METKNIMIVGVGGQGSLLASKLLGHLLLTQGYDVKVSEVHGMSQRGGSVVTYVRFGDKVYSPVIDRGEADIIVSFELLEAARYLPYLKEGGRIVTNTQRIDPMPVVTGACAYPEDLIRKMGAGGRKELRHFFLCPYTWRDLQLNALLLPSHLHFEIFRI
jgi:indolepyruvate ferredoxin oxidoreductase beta subunit